MKVSFPAMQGQIGQRTYYACLMKLNAIPKMFTFRDWAEFSPDEREQRILNKKRIPEIARYMLDHEEGYLFASITASFKCDAEFSPVEEGSHLGLLEMEFEEANFIINDGQHRCAAIAQAIKMNPLLGEEEISVLLFPYESRERVQQMFSDLNRFVVKTSKSLNILFDKRDPLSEITLKMIEQVPAFAGLVEKDAVSLGIRSPKLFSLSGLYDANGELLQGQESLTPEESLTLASSFWNAISTLIPEWQAVQQKTLKPLELRQESISAHATILRALGAVGSQLLIEHPADWQKRLSPLKGIDFRRKSPQWEGVNMIGGNVISNRQSRLATRAVLKQALHLSLSDSELRSIEPHSIKTGGSKVAPVTQVKTVKPRSVKVKAGK